MRQPVDRVGVVVMVVFVALWLVRGLIPALIDGANVGIALLVTALTLFALGLSLLPMRRRRPALGRLTSPP